jgi:hypothetical protein
MYNAEGQIVKAVRITSAEQQLSISELPDGIYFYRAENNDTSQVTNGKIVIQRR